MIAIIKRGYRFLAARPRLRVTLQAAVSLVLIGALVVAARSTNLIESFRAIQPSAIVIVKIPIKPRERRLRLRPMRTSMFSATSCQWLVVSCQQFNTSASCANFLLATQNWQLATTYFFPMT